MDVITAYLLGLLDKEIYMVQPEGFVKTGMKRNLVCRVLRSLYGLKQAARMWNQKIHIVVVVLKAYETWDCALRLAVSSLAVSS